MSDEKKTKTQPIGTMCSPSLPFPPHFRESALVAHHEEGRRVGAAHEVVQVERFSDDEAGAVEGVAGLELGVLASQHLESFIAEMFELHPAVGRPGNVHAVAHIQTGRVEGATEDHVRGFTCSIVILAEVVPVVEAHAAGQDGERGVAGGVVAVDVAPDALEGGHAERLLAAFLDHAGEELEVGRGLHLARDGLLHHCSQSLYGCVVSNHHKSSQIINS